jgi:YVTN family beta-propeller protein
MHFSIPVRAAACLLLAAAGAAWALAPGTAHANGIAFVINSNDASISEIDVTTQKEIRRIPVLREPHHMALTPDGKSLVIGDTTGNALFFLDPRTGAVQRQVTVSDPYQLTFSPDGRWLTITGLARNQVDVYDAATMQLVHRIPASAMPSHINYSPDSSMAFISLQESDSLMAIEPASGKVLWKSRVGKTPAGVLWHDGKVLVGLMGQDGVAVVDPVDGHVERFIRTGRGAHVLVSPSDGSVLYVTNRVDGTISVLDPRTLDVMRSIKVPGGPDDMDFAPDGHLWASLRWHQSVAVIDPQKGVLDLIPVGRSPHGIWLNTHMTAPQAVRAGS